MRTFIAFLTLVVANTGAFATSAFTYETTYWFNKIKAECKLGTCDVFLNGELKGNYEYTMKNSVASIIYDEYLIQANLETGKFTYKKQ